MAVVNPSSQKKAAKDVCGMYDNLTQAVARMPNILAVMTHHLAVPRDFLPHEPAVITRDVQEEGQVNKQRVNNIGTLGWFVTLAWLLLLGLFPNQVPAGDLTTGSSTTIDDNINTTAFDPLVNCTFTLPANTIHVCTATCSAEANGSAIPEGSRDNNYELGLSLDGSFLLGCRRSFQFSNEFNIADVDVMTVTTTCGFSVAGGGRTISCQARKQAASDATITINDSSITCHCGHSTHQ